MEGCIACDGTCGNTTVRTIKQDTIVASVIENFRQRSEIGQQKYGTTLDRTDLTFLDWVNHMQEELMDAILYLEKLKKVSTRSFTGCVE